MHSRYSIVLLFFVHIFTALYITLGEAFTMFCPSLQVKGKAVLVTGCDCGFGHALAKHLHKLGFTVFAGCLLKVTDKIQSERPIRRNSPDESQTIQYLDKGPLSSSRSAIACPIRKEIKGALCSFVEERYIVA